MADEPHAAALLTRLNTVPATTDVHDGTVPSGATPPYVLAYISTETTQQATLTGQSDVTVARLYAHCVGETAASARLVQQQVVSVMLNYSPTISGRSVSMVREEAVRPPDRDETTGELVMDAVAEFSLTTYPA